MGEVKNRLCRCGDWGLADESWCKNCSQCVSCCECGDGGDGFEPVS